MNHAILAVMLALCATGCNSGKRITKANDALRLERETQRERITALESENAELKSKNSELNARLESPLSEDVLAAMPRVASIEIYKFSGLTYNYRGSTASITIIPKDGKGRFVQAVARVEVRVVELGENETDPKVLASQTITPEKLRDLYTSSLAGPGYTIDMYIESVPSSPVTFLVILHDELTGESHEASYVAHRWN